MKNVNDFRLDWRGEWNRILPFIQRKGGVVVLKYASEEAAPEKFNHLLKESFRSSTNTPWESIRIDRKFYTTHQAAGVLDEFDRLLGNHGFQVDLPKEPSPTIEIMTGQEAGGNITNTINGLHVHTASGYSGRAFRDRAQVIFEALRRYVAAGGRFMVTLNDMALEEQTDFWNRVWSGGLREAGGTSLLLVIHAGPASGMRWHHDCPQPDLTLTLPTSVEEDSERDDHFYDDLLAAFEKSGLPSEVASAAAGVHLENNRASILDLNFKLSASLMAALKNRAPA